MKHPISQKTRDRYRKAVSKMESFVVRKLDLKPRVECGPSSVKKIDLTLKCTEIERYYDGAIHAIDRCCHEPVPIFEQSEENNGTVFSYGASLPYLIGFTVGKKYRIRIEEVE